MRKLILALSIISIAFGCNTANKKETVTIKGSDTVLPLTQKEMEAYQKKHSEAAISVTGGGSGVGIAALLSGTTDIA
ncbi:MAG: substrate-binding domain-containing protein, partial [Bacteroidales bacterium]|nr:substrate-binding domain-containing protein [Bacteroidales bacterium]